MKLSLNQIDYNKKIMMKIQKIFWMLIKEILFLRVI